MAADPAADPGSVAATPAADPSVVALGGARPPRALYIHVPFCLSICPYCDFVVYSGRAARGPEARLDALTAGLHAELDLRADMLDAAFRTDRPGLRSVYLGGGTPSLLGARRVAGLLDHVARRLGMAARAEVTLEANPGAEDRGDLAAFGAAGVNRLSLGAQSLEAGELQHLGRRHGPGDVADAMAEARAAGFRDVSLDLLYDVPGQTVASWDRSLRTVSALQPDHVSTYALTLDDPDAEGLTGPLGDHLPLRSGARRWRSRARRQQDDDRAAQLYELACERLERAGFLGYELSNWATPGHECRHNLAYWRREPYEALGPGAHAFDGAATRRWNAARLEPYLAAVTPAPSRAPVLPPGGEERLDAATVRAEAAILGLRLGEGVETSLAHHAGVSAALSWASEQGLVEHGGGRSRLTRRGRLLSNEVFMRLLPAA